jgi:DNA polymerase V
MEAGLIRKRFNVIVERIVHELRGTTCLELDALESPHKSIVVSRSFGKPITTLSQMQEAIATYTCRLGEKLRRYGRVTNFICLFMRAYRFTEKPLYQSLEITLPEFTDDTFTLLNYALSHKLTKVFQEGVPYKKAGVMALNLQPKTNYTQRRMFASVQETIKDDAKTHTNELCNHAVDSLNRRFGKHTVRPAICGLIQPWQMQCNLRTPPYTTDWDQLRVVE